MTKGEFSITQLKALESIQENIDFVNENLQKIMGSHSSHLTDAKKGIVKIKKENESYKIVYASANIVKTLGFKMEDVIGLNILSFHKEEDQINILKDLENLQSGIPVIKTYDINVLGETIKLNSTMTKGENLLTELIEVL